MLLSMLPLYCRISRPLVTLGCCYHRLSSKSGRIRIQLYIIQYNLTHIGRVGIDP